MAAKRTSAVKKSPVKKKTVKTAAKKAAPPTKKAAGKKPAASKTASPKKKAAAAKKATPSKKKAPASKKAAKPAAKKASKPAPKKAPAKKAAPKAAKKSPAKATKPVSKPKAAKKTAAKKSPPKQSPVKKADKPATKKVSNPAAKKTPAKKAAPVEKAPAAKKAAPKKAIEAKKAPEPKAPKTKKAKAAAAAKAALPTSASPGVRRGTGRRHTEEDEGMTIEKKKGKVKMTPFLKAQRQRLIDLRDAYLNTIEGVSNETIRNAGDSGSASAFGMHQADAGSDAYDRDFALSLLGKEQDALYEINEAIDRLDSGTYGICEMSGEQIPEIRLEALPFARFTVQCQEKIERQNMGGRWNQPVRSLFGLDDAGQTSSDADDDSDSLDSGK